MARADLSFFDKDQLEKLSVTSSDIYNYYCLNDFKALKDLNLISGEKGVFTINPQIFWKGDEKARKAFMGEQEIKIKFSI